MFDTLPQEVITLSYWSWSQIEPYYQDLATRPLDSGNIVTFLTDWTRLSERVDEMQARLHVATTLNTTDQEAEQRAPLAASDRRRRLSGRIQRLGRRSFGRGGTRSHVRHAGLAQSDRR